MARAMSARCARLLGDFGRAEALGEVGLRASYTNPVFTSLERLGFVRTEPSADRMLTALWVLTPAGRTALPPPADERAGFTGRGTR